MSGIAIYYLVLFLISVLCTCIYAFLWHKHFSVNFTLIFTIVPLANLGYVVRETSETLEGALFGQKLTYLGGCFLILFITFYVFDMCKISLPKYLMAGMILIDMLLYLFVLDIGRDHLFYRSVRLEKVGERFVLIKEYGPLHSLFHVLLIVYLLMGIVAMIYAFRKKDVSRRILWLLLVPEGITVFGFFGGKLIPGSVEVTPLGYVFAEIMYLLVAHFICLYDVADMAIDSITETGDTGFISFDRHLIYLGSDDTAKEIFEDLALLTIDRPLDRSEKLTELFRPWIEAFSEDPTKDKYYYKKGENVYLVDINDLYHNGNIAGFQLVISDDTKNQKYIELLDNYNARLAEEVKKKTADIVTMHNNLIRSMAKLVESRDNSTGGHIIRTSDVVELLMDEIMADREFVKKNGITEEFRKNLIKAAPLHDIGKIAVDDEILRKPGRFTEDEFEKMKQHAPEGAKVLKAILADTKDETFKKLAENVAHYHHERMDGSGYPEGLKAGEIPLEARIMAIADVYDALVSKRVYKESMPFDKADEIMMESMGKHFDKNLERFYVSARPKMEEYYRERAESNSMET
ncbi:MAG: HD domain-containing protein [Lachnospiraceae bacterium]|nr:HD domain-containing protein [Lachnospiraceae bacterium]